MKVQHPVKPLGGLYLHRRRQRFGIVKRRRLDVDKSRKDRRIPVEQPGTAVGAETPHCCAGRVDRPGLSLGHRQGSLGKHGPSHRRRSCASPAVAAMTQGHNPGRARKLIVNGSTQAPSGKVHRRISWEWALATKLPPWDRGFARSTPVRWATGGTNSWTPQALCSYNKRMIT